MLSLFVRTLTIRDNQGLSRVLSILRVFPTARRWRPDCENQELVAKQLWMFLQQPLKTAWLTRLLHQQCKHWHVLMYLL